jgi:hypothetical protein
LSRATLENIEQRVLPAVTVLSYDAPAARVYGQIRARLESAGRPPADAEPQIAATALLHDLELVTRNVKHFKRVPHLRISPRWRMPGSVPDRTHHHTMAGSSGLPDHFGARFSQPSFVTATVSS